MSRLDAMTQSVHVQGKGVTYQCTRCTTNAHTHTHAPGLFVSLSKHTHVSRAGRLLQVKVSNRDLGIDQVGSLGNGGPSEP
eukprot:2957685-Amphidinium_carterae.1